jgi:putative transcriptional regulator
VKPRHEIRSQVRQHRLLRDMTQEELAERIGVTRQTIVSIEKGNYTPSVALALGLAAVLGTTVEALFALDTGESDA